MKTAYARSYYPPAPMIEIWLASPERAFAPGPLRAFVDTGADGSLIPAQMLRQLGVDLFDVKRQRSQWGESRSVETYLVDVGIGSLRLPLVEMVSDDASDEVLLGRNILNRGRDRRQRAFHRAHRPPAAAGVQPDRRLRGSPQPGVLLSTTACAGLQRAARRRQH